jgi:hypothetical protein
MALMKEVLQNLPGLVGGATSVHFIASNDCLHQMHSFTVSVTLVVIFGLTTRATMYEGELDLTELEIHEEANRCREC